MIKEARKVLKVFKHCGWVNGLEENQYDALNELQAAMDKFDEPKNLKNKNRATAKALRKDGLTIREIAKEMGYKHPGSISYLLQKQNHD